MNTSRFSRASSALTALLLCVAVSPVRAQTTQTATLTIDVRKVENRISPLLYGQFLEFMYEGIKGGLHAELIRNRSFEEPPNAIGLSRYWERYPDDRNDDYGLSFQWDGEIAYPPQRKLTVETGEREMKDHSLRVQAGDGVIPRHGLYQSRIPIRAGVDYRGYLWLRSSDYKGVVTIALESDVDEGEIYAAADVNGIAGDWRKYEFTLRPTRSDPARPVRHPFSGPRSGVGGPGVVTARRRYAWWCASRCV